MKHPSILLNLTLFVLMLAVFTQPLASSIRILIQDTSEIVITNPEDSEGNESQNEDPSEEENVELKYLFTDVPFTDANERASNFNFSLTIRTSISLEIPFPPPDLT